MTLSKTCWISSGLVVAVASTAQATQLLPPGGAPLKEILGGSYGGSFQVLDKRFDFTHFGGTGSLAADILVVPVVFPNPLDGIGFDLIFSDVTIHDDDREAGNDDGAPTSLAFSLEYDVTITEPGFAIKDVLLAVQGTSLTGGDDDDGDNGDAFLQVTEEYMGIGLMQSLVVEDDASGALFQTQDFFKDNPQQSLSVVKDILLFASGGDGRDGDDDDDATVSVDFIRQTFSQIPSPGPVAIALMGVPLLARRRR